MKILFINPTCTIVNFGIRALAGYIDAKGHDSKLMFLQTPLIDFDYDYPKTVYQDLDSALSSCDIVAFSFVTNYAGQAQKLTKHIKNNYTMPVIWGGIHAMAFPEQSLDFADIVCMGEGEEALLQLLNKMDENEDYFSIPNLCFKKGSKIIKNPVADLVQDLDRYPFQLYDMQKEYILDSGRIIPMSIERMKKELYAPKHYFGFKKHHSEMYSYTTMTSRGCPHSCTYCCNSMFRKLYQGKGKIVRKRSTENIIEELELVLNKYPFLNLIEFFDDDFISSRGKTLTEFAELYKARINLPFRCNISPSSVSDEKIGLLKDAGLVVAEMGLQTASDRINKDIFNRHQSNHTFIKAAEILNKHDIISYYDVILDNPFETSRDIAETLRFLYDLPNPVNISTFSLVFYPGSELFKLAKSKKMIKNDISQIYNSVSNTLHNYRDPYIKFLIFLLRFAKKRDILPKRIFYGLTSQSSLSILNNITFRWFWASLLFFKTWFGTKILHKNDLE